MGGGALAGLLAAPNMAWSAEGDALRQRIDAKRAEMEDFQRRHQIVSAERGENIALNRVRDMSASMNEASKRAVEAEARLHSLQQSGGGKSAVRSRDNPTLAAAEQRASQLREELRDLARVFTPDYLDIDPNAKAKRARLAELEEQIERERAGARDAALSDAREELAGAREAERQLQQQLAADRRNAQDFSMRFNQYQAMQAELDQLEKLHAGASERLVRLEASEAGRRPHVSVIEAATLPTTVWQPKYARDAAISVGSALLLALLAVWLVDYVQPREPAPSFAPAPQWIPIAMHAERPSPRPVIAAREMDLLPGVKAMPRELSRSEVAALLLAADDQTRLALRALLAGINAEELLALRWEDIDRESGVASIAGTAARELPLPGTLLEELARRPMDTTYAPAGPLLATTPGHALTADDLTGLVLCAAHDAGLDDPAEVTPAALQHTYAAYLVRQGVRFADLAPVLGRLSPDALAAYSALAPDGPRLAAEQIDWSYPSREDLPRPTATGNA
jgi:hypothetical protein